MNQNNQADYNGTSLEATIIKQTPTIDGWICPTCVNYKGKLICKENIFIAFVGASMINCFAYESGVICKHCGKVT